MTEQCKQPFQEGKRLITSKQVLTHVDQQLPINLACDASPDRYWGGALTSYPIWDGKKDCFCISISHPG